MSKWTEVRDCLVSALDANEVAETAKNQVIASLTGEGMAAIEAVATKFVEQVQTQAATESGWSKARDLIILPLVINTAIWLIKLVFSKSTPEQV